MHLGEGLGAVDGGLLSLDGGLNCGVGDAAAVDTGDDTSVPSQVQRGLGGSLKGNAKLDGNAEVLGGLARHQVTPTERCHGRRPVEVDLPLSGDRRGGVAVKRRATKGKALSRGHSCRRRDRVADVGKHSRTDVKFSGKWKNVVMRFHGLETQLAIVGYT